MTLTLPPSLWAHTAPPAPECPILDGAACCEVAVVGAGFTGLSAALHLAEAGVDVRVLEAGEPGWGASGRNGGQVNPGWKALPSAIVKRYGRNAGERAARLAGNAPDLVFELIHRFDIDCQPRRAGYVQGAPSYRALEKSRAWAREWQALGAPVRELDREAITALTGTDAYVGGFLDERGGNLQPLAYARGLARAGIVAGARIHGASRAHTLTRRTGGWRLTTPGGELNASKVIVAGNGYTDGLVPGLARELVPVKSVIAATEPLSDNVRSSILAGGHHVSESRRVGVYFRMDAQGRFLMGGRGATFGPLDASDADHLLALSYRMYPQLAGCRWTHRWSGFVGMTPEAMPRLVNLGGGVFSGLGFNGRGVAMGTAMGRELALAVRGEQTALPIGALAPIPAHGLRKLAVASRVTLGRLLDRLDAGRA